MITESETWNENNPITIKIKRTGAEQTIKGTVKLPYIEKETFKPTDASKEKHNRAWLKN